MRRNSPEVHGVEDLPSLLSGTEQANAPRSGACLAVSGSSETAVRKDGREALTGTGIRTSHCCVQTQCHE